MKRYDATGLLAVVTAFGLMAAYRALGVEPGFSACAQQPRMVACEPRAVLLWLQHWQVFGGAALVLGIWALRGAPFAVRVAAVALGAVAVVNYNMTWGIAGAALGAWVWLSEGSSPAANRVM